MKLLNGNRVTDELTLGSQEAPQDRLWRRLVTPEIEQLAYDRISGACSNLATSVFSKPDIRIGA